MRHRDTDTEGSKEEHGNRGKTKKRETAPIGPLLSNFPFQPVPQTTRYHCAAVKKSFIHLWQIRVERGPLRDIPHAKRRPVSGMTFSWLMDKTDPLESRYRSRKSSLHESSMSSVLWVPSLMPQWNGNTQCPMQPKLWWPFNAVSLKAASTRVESCVEED